jgi:threonyl-tRNA synthetase
MLVIGDREAEEGTVSVRRHREGDLGSEPVADFAARVAAQVAERVDAPVGEPAA